MNSLKRQAAKAERFSAVRDELRGRLRVVLASRMAMMDADQARLEAEIAALTGQINVSAVEIEEIGGRAALPDRARIPTGQRGSGGTDTSQYRGR